MTETNTPSVEGDRLEQIADRVLAERRKSDPLAPRDLADLIRRLGGEVRIPITDGLGPAGGDEPDNPLEHVQRWDGVPAIQQDAAAVLSALSARQIAALPCKGGEVAGWLWTHPILSSRVMPHPVPEEKASTRWKSDPLHTAAPSPEPDTGRGLREALEPFAKVADIYDDREDDEFEVWVDAGPVRMLEAGTFKLKHFRRARQALAALSDTHETPEISEVETESADGPPGPPSLTAEGAIAAERRRQIEVEGWTPEHDDEHDDGQLLRAGMIYLHWGTELGAPWDAGAGAPMTWPWAPEWFKPKDRRANLIRAGALFLAERQRLQRASNSYHGHVDHKLSVAIRKLAELNDGEAEGSSTPDASPTHEIPEKQA